MLDEVLIKAGEVPEVWVGEVRTAVPFPDLFSRAEAFAAAPKDAITSPLHSAVPCSAPERVD